MKQQAFESKYGEEWQEFERMLQALEGKKPAGGDAVESQDFPAYYRRMCHYLSLAKERQYSSRLIERLNDWVLRGHQQLYYRKISLLSAIQEFIVVGFPSVVRQQWGYCLAAIALFYLPALILGGFVLLFPELIYSVLDPESLVEFEAMYDPAARHIGWSRDADSDFYMFGYYIQNNISVGFRTFASGVIYGLGSIFFLAYNGIILGGLSAHIMNIEYHETFFSFVVGHSSFELTAIVLSGAAGIKLGFALVAPGRHSRLEALRRAAAVAIRMIYGVILLLLIAAFIEAFWSSSTLVANWLKYSVGAALWLFVIFYFTVMGRRRGA